MKPKVFQLSVITLSDIVSLTSIIFSYNIWIFFGVSNTDIHSSLTLVSSIFVLFFGFLLSYYSNSVETTREISRIKTEIFENLKIQDNIKVYRGIDALITISKILSQCRIAYNIRITPKNVHESKFYVGEVGNLPEVMTKAIKNGLSVKEVFAFKVSR